jgi:hypothetical protein
LPDAIVDTVVLRYFALAGESDLLIRLLGEPIGAPRIVYDPDEGAAIPAEARSEITRSVEYQRRVSTDPARDRAAQEQANVNATRLASIRSLHDVGLLAVIDLEPEELDLFGRLTSPSRCRDFGLRFPLDPGEAACLAIAVERHLILATDDTDALRALERHAPGHPYERIRKLLIRAGNDGLCSPARANAIHAEIRRLGFWDNGQPFPET